jgi:Resolvase, N terminal domain
MTTKRTKSPHASSCGKPRLSGAAEAWRGHTASAGTAGHSAGKPMLIGYARVSTADQNLALQRDAITEAGCGIIFIEQMSGAITDRPALHDALECARSGYTLIVWKLDRLARSMKQLIGTVEQLRMRGIGSRSRTEALDTTTARDGSFFICSGR